MARLPDEMVERIKREISVERLAEARGIKLKRSGKELIGLCPFHKDTHPSLNIDPVKNVWHCKGACGVGGSVIDWVMRAEGISTRYALELLSRDLVPTSPSAGPPPKQSTVPKLPPLFASTVDDQQALKIVVNYYHETLKNSPDSPKAKQYLVQRGLESSEMIEHFRLGFSNRTLNYHVPDKNRAAGAEIRGRLEKLGILRQDSGHEHFNGSVVIPIFNLQGELVQMYGRKITARLRPGTDYHLYLPGPLRGVWNEEALIASKEIILCEALIDALTFWCAGFRHVTTSYGVNGFTAEIKAAFRRHGSKKIYIAYDRDEAGENAAQRHAEELMQMGIECFRVKFPKGQDANEFALKTRPPGKALGVFLNSAEWLGKSKRPAVAVIEPQQIEPTAPIPAAATQANIEEDAINPAAKEKIPEPGTTPADEKIPESVPSLAAKAEEPSTAAKRKNAPIEIKGDEVTIRFGDRRYRIRGLGKNMSHGTLKVNVFVSRANGRGELRYFGDTFDLYQARPRLSFSQQAAEELELQEETVRRELGEVWLQLERLQEEQIEKALTPAQDEAPLSAEEKVAALEMLRDPHLLERVVEDFERCGIVGEETNKKVSYLAAVSRLLEKPLAIIVQSSSSAGKSSLMEAVLDFMPEEQRESYTAMTGQALFYMGEKNLQHKILAIAEQQGAERAAYPLKLLQSEGRLKIASTSKDPVSGKHVAHEYLVEGPVMIFLTTTAQEVDEELMNRAVVLAVNEEREQTRAIHRKQREAQTLEGLMARTRQNKIIKLHRNAQRLLRPIRIVNEHLTNLDFPDTMTRTRRDHAKFLTLISAITLLHQYQREIKTIPCDGETLEYIEATEADVKLAWELTNHVLVRSLDDVPLQTRRLLLLLDEMVGQECERLQIERLDYRFTRATVRKFTGWSDSQLKTHLRRLEELEYLALHRGVPGQSYVYALNFEMDENGKPVLPGLSYGARRSRWESNRSGFPQGVSGLQEQRSGSSLGQVWGVSGGGRGKESPVMTRASGAFSEESDENAYKGQSAENRIVVVPERVARPKGNGMQAQAVK
jgi:DNA primase catalytic core